MNERDLEAAKMAAQSYINVALGHGRESLPEGYSLKFEIQLNGERLAMRQIGDIVSETAGPGVEQDNEDLHARVGELVDQRDDALDRANRLDEENGVLRERNTELVAAVSRLSGPVDIARSTGRE